MGKSWVKKAWRRSVTDAATGVHERPDCRNEAPAVPLRKERECQDPECLRVAYLAVRLRRLESPQTLPARADHELAKSALHVAEPARCLWGEPLVLVVVTDEHDVGSFVEEGSPKREIQRVASVLAGREARVMPVRERAPHAAVGLEICS